jgi:hypothetical protein
MEYFEKISFWRQAAPFELSLNFGDGLAGQAAAVVG